MANITEKLRKYYTHLLVLSIMLILVGDRGIYDRTKTASPVMPEKNASLNRSAHEEGSGGEQKNGQDHLDHSDPVNQKRMGIFHYNEGNKFLRKGNVQEAVNNYKMALRHDPDNANFYINLSTAYMSGERFDKAHETLMTLEDKAPQHPLLYYNLACYYALINETSSSRKALEKSAALGFKNFNKIQTDPDFENLRKTSGFQKWLKSLKQQALKL